MTTYRTVEQPRRRHARDSHGFASNSDSESDDGQNMNDGMHNTSSTISSDSGESFDARKYCGGEGDDGNTISLSPIPEHDEDEEGYSSTFSPIPENDDGEEDNYEEPEPHLQSPERISTAIDRYRDTTLDLYEQLATAKRENEKNTAEISALKKTVDRLTRMVEDLTEKSNSTEDLNRRITKVEEHVEKRVGRLSEKLERVQTRVDGLRDDVKNLEDAENWTVRYATTVGHEVRGIMQKMDNLHEMQGTIKKLDGRLWKVSEQACLAKEYAVRAGSDARRLVDEDLRLEREENRGLKRKLEQMEGVVERESTRRELAEARVNNLARDLQLAASSSLPRQ